MRKKLILVASERMDNNRKDDRNEHGLVRMSAIARDYMGFHDDTVELWPVGSSGEDRINKAIVLKIFHAFGGDLKDVKTQIKRNERSKEEYRRIGFVTTKIFDRICGGDRKIADNIWISDDIYDTVMGADPEFLLFDGNKIVDARDVLPYHGAIGSDGPMAEIRPKPEVLTEKLVDNMVKIFEDNLDNPSIKDYRWLASCFHKNDHRGFPVGGHIHVGNPVQVVRQSGSFKHNLYRVMNKIMDEYLTVPLIKLDGHDGKGRRDRNIAYSGYGGFGDFRTDHGRLEHRSVSGMWLLNPSIAKAVLGTAKAVVDEIFRLISEEKFSGSYILPSKFEGAALYSSFDEWNKIPLAKDMRCTRSSEWMKSTINSSDIKMIDQKFISDLHGKLKKLSTYGENNRYIDGLCEVLKMKSAEISKLERDIKKTWTKGKKFVVDI